MLMGLFKGFGHWVGTFSCDRWVCRVISPRLAVQVMTPSPHYWRSSLLVLLVVTVTLSIGTPRAIAASVIQPALVAQTSSTLPAAIGATLKQDLSRRTRIPLQQIRIISSQAKTWPDGCLGLADPGQMCTQAIVEGWRVVLGHGQQRWVYRTDAQGRTYRLEPVKPGLKKPNRSSEALSWIPLAELPPQLRRGEVFRVITAGGITGRVTQTILMADGRMLRSQLAPIDRSSNPQVHQVSTDQLRQFQFLLRQHSLQPFHRRDYLAPVGSADVQTMTLSAKSGTVRYAETQRDQLPPDLQVIVQAWEHLTRLG